MRRAIEAFGSGVVVYVVMAACSSSGGGGGLALDASAGGTSAAGGASTWDALTDTLTDPVNDAHAASSQMQEAACNIPHTYNGGTYYFAEFAFPGRTQQELSLASAFVHPQQPYDLPSGGYDWINATQYFVKDGSILVFCSIGFFATVGGQGNTARVVVPD